MDRYLKERLVGAAVLVAAAIILIPEMLSGPRDAAVAPELVADKTDASGVKTYTIDLSAPQPTGQRATTTQAQVVETPAPPPETLLPAEAPPVMGEAVRASPESLAAQEAVDRNARELEEFAAEKKTSEKEKVSDKSVVAKPAVPVATNAAKPADKRTAGAWAVQVASFGVRATSERIAADLQSKGFPAFVTASDVKGQTMYRVRVGPAPDRTAAEALLKKIKPLHSGAAVVPQ